MNRAMSKKSHPIRTPSALAAVGLGVLALFSCLYEDPESPDVDAASDSSTVDTQTDLRDIAEEDAPLSQCCEIPDRIWPCSGEMPIEPPIDYVIGGRRRTPAEVAMLRESQETSWIRFDDRGCRITRLNVRPPETFEIRDDEGCPYWSDEHGLGCGDRDVPETGVDAGNDADDTLPDATDTTGEGSFTPDTTEPPE